MVGGASLSPSIKLSIEFVRAFDGRLVVGSQGLAVEREPCIKIMARRSLRAALSTAEGLNECANFDTLLGVSPTMGPGLGSGSESLPQKGWGSSCFRARRREL